MNRRQFFQVSSLFGLSLAVGKSGKATAKVIDKPKAEPNIKGWKFDRMVKIDVNGIDYWMPTYTQI